VYITDKKEIAKFAAKDSVFRDIFKYTKHLLELYKSLHPEDTSVTEKDVTPRYS
jgi:hypothetical protein